MMASVRRNARRNPAQHRSGIVSTLASPCRDESEVPTVSFLYHSFLGFSLTEASSTQIELTDTEISPAGEGIEAASRSARAPSSG